MKITTFLEMMAYNLVQHRLRGFYCMTLTRANCNERILHLTILSFLVLSFNLNFSLTFILYHFLI
jgi:hypothetical protein